MLPKLRGGPGILASLPGPAGNVALRSDISEDERAREVLGELSAHCEALRTKHLAYVDGLNEEPEVGRAWRRLIEGRPWWQLLEAGRPIIESAEALGEAPGALAYWIASELRPPNAALLEWMAFAFNAIGRELRQRDELAHIEQQDLRRTRARAAIGAKGGLSSGQERARRAKARHVEVARIYRSVRETHDERDAVNITIKRLEAIGMPMSATSIRAILDKAGVRPKKKRN